MSSSARAEKTKTAITMENPHARIASEELAGIFPDPTTIPRPLAQVLQLRARLGTPASAQCFLKVSRGVDMMAPVLYECLAPLK